MNIGLVEFQEKFLVQQNKIFQSDFWTLSLRPMQPTIGSCVISLNRYCEKMSDITDEESCDLKKVVSYAERSLMAAFSYDKINYLMLMMVDSHLHFHVIPRYSKVIEALGRIWKDEKWPTPPDLGGVEIEQALSDELIATLKKYGNENEHLTR